MNLKTILVLFVTALFSVSAVQAQPEPITVCRDPRFLSPVRLEFHNIPADWFEWGGPSWGYAAMAAGGYAEAGVLVADAFEVETDGYPANSATIYSGDFILAGDADSPLCDVAQSPVQDEGLEIVITPEPTAEPTELNCPFVWLYPFPYCYTPVASGIIPIPPAPKN